MGGIRPLVQPEAACMEASDSLDTENGNVSSSDAMRSLAPSIQTVWRIKGAALGAVVFLPVLFYDLTNLFSEDAWLPSGILTGVFLLLLLVYVGFWPWLRYRAWGFALWSEELYREFGVIIHVRTIVPLRRIQHVDVSQDLLEREFALGRLVVHTAGSRSSDVVIPGLPLSEAERIRDEIKRFILEDPLLEDPV